MSPKSLATLGLFAKTNDFICGYQFFPTRMQCCVNIDIKANTLVLHNDLVYQLKLSLKTAIMFKVYSLNLEPMFELIKTKKKKFLTEQSFCYSTVKAFTELKSMVMVRWWWLGIENCIPKIFYS